MPGRIVSSILATAALLLGLLGPALPAAAQRSDQIVLVRDAEIENAIRIMCTPIWRAANLDPSAIEVHLVQDRRINAFVAGGQRIFINTGLIMRTETPGQLLGVLAHETGHIRGAHLIDLQEALRNATAQMILETILAGAAVAAAPNRRPDGYAAGGRTGSNVPGPPSAPGALKTLLSYTRSQEQQADRAGVTFLERAGISPRGMLEVMRMLQQQERIYVGSNADPYLRSHPMSSERIAFLEDAVAHSRVMNAADPPQFRELHARIVAKTLGYFEPQRALQKYPQTDNSTAGRYGRAMALYRMGQTQAAVAMADQLIRENPRDPYFQEFKGDVLRDSGKMAAAIGAYSQAVALLPHEPALRFSLGQAQFNAGQRAAAIKTLDQVVQLEPTNVGAWDLLQQAYDAAGNTAMRDLAAAEYFYLQGNRSQAVYKAEAASRALPRGTPAWLRAQDIKAAVEANRPRR